MDLLSWVLGASIYGSGLIVLVQALKAVAGRWMSAQWHYAIWLLVFMRLVLPGGPQTDFSMGNVWRLKNVAGVNGEQHGKTFSGLLPGVHNVDASQEAVTLTASTARNTVTFDIVQVLLLVWGVGAVIYLLIVGLQAMRVRSLIKDARPVDDEVILALFQDCRLKLKVGQNVQLLFSDDISYPALAGIMRPVVLIPSTTPDSVSMDELRFILVHELMHLRRRDLLVAMTIAPVLAMHWFNPLVWYAWYRMRQDREIACDAAVVQAMGDGVAADYGRTLLKLTEQIVPQQRMISGAVGIMEGQSETRRRIVMLSNYRKSCRARGWTGALVAGMLVAVGFTSAQVENVTAVDTLVTSPSGEMPEIEEIPADVKKRLAAQKQFLETIGRVTTTSNWPLPMPPVPRGKLFEKQTPFMITVDEKYGKLVHTYSPEPKKLISMSAEKTVVLSTAETTITAEKLKYTVADEILSAEGPGLSVSLANLVYKADRLEWDLKNSTMKLDGGVKITDKSNGNISKTYGDRITISTGHGTADAPLP